MSETIHKSKLCELTGLDEERLRQIALEGFFPKAVKGEYLFEPTVKGLFNYYRDNYQFARKSKVELEQEKLRKQVESLDLDIQKKKNELVPAVEVERVWGTISRNLTQVIISADIPHNTKEELCAHLREVARKEYAGKESDYDES